MYDRTIVGEIHTFGVSGKLIRNVLVMFDRESDSLWSQLLGEAVDGPLLGTKLKPIAALQTTWGEWKKLHPDTLALAIGGPAYDSYVSYYSSNSAGVIGETFQDERLPRKELVYGLVIDGQAVVYPFSRLAEQRIANDTVAGQPVAVIFDPATRTALAFRREVDGQTLTFRPGDGEGATFVDEETGSTWAALTGAAASGPLQGKGLERLPGTSSFWFGWKDFYPDTLVYGQ
ncbi:MAG: DUF3179 domain-containing protein [Chloroflexi bacterium]|nr:DUF3179 domain-containing protein [Chloroflexota bacterium]